MRNTSREYMAPFVSHIYIETAAAGHPRTAEILSRFKDAERIEISHYKDVFCRRGQNSALQHRAQNLILAVKTGSLLYQGAKVCQSFGNENFYYTSCMMNCIYDCEYCYLKGMYPSGNIVIFVNLEDIFREVEQALSTHSMYLCVSYDTDLLAFESVLGYAGAWRQFAGRHKNLKLEIRTKSADIGFWQRMAAYGGGTDGGLECMSGYHGNVIYAFTLSPQKIIAAYERHTPPLAARLACAAEAVRAGLPVRLCFDPMLYCADWRARYDELLRQVFSEIDMEKILDVSVGTFRVSQEYLKNMRKNEPDSAIVQFPYENNGGVYQYPGELGAQMEQFLVERLKQKIPEEKIFLWSRQ